MKKIICLVAFLAILPLQGQWVLQNSGTSELLNDVYCITEDLAFVVGDNGTILKTTDGGTTWIQKSSGINAKLKKVTFTSISVGYAIAEISSTGDNFILKTINGGENWTTILSFSNTGSGYSADISCINDNKCYFSNQGTLIKSEDGGVSTQLITTTQCTENIQFLNENIGFSSCGTSLNKTIDGGLTWLNIGSVDANSGRSPFYFFSENVGYVKTMNTMHKTSDGGINYSNITTYDSVMNKLLAVSENIVWSIPVECALNGSPCYSSRGEMSAGNFQSQTGLPFKSLHFTNSTKGYAILDSNIYKNTTGTMLGLNEIPVKNKVSIFPNPASEQISISFNEKSTEPFSVEIIDFLGKKVYSQFYNGDNTLSIDSKTFSKGVYLVTVISQDKRETQKVILN